MKKFRSILVGVPGVLASVLGVLVEVLGVFGIGMVYQLHLIFGIYIFGIFIEKIVEFVWSSSE